jgi:precorrin-2 dehydrogenase / sirohydrochlorin ferrochelatase
MAEARPGYYAVYLDLAARSCLVLGGGAAAAEKARGLAAAGADVTVVSPAFEDGLVQMGGRHDVRLLARAFVEGDLDGVELVIDASGDDPQGVRVAEAARRRRVLVNVLDRTPLCDFIAPAMVRRGALQVAISTAGRSPFMASHVRQLLEGMLGPEYGDLVELVGELRDRLRHERLPLAQQTVVYQRIPESGAIELLRDGDLDGARRAVQGCVTEPTEVQPALF